MSTCPFCLIPDGDVLDENARAVAVRDRYPVTPGHTLIIPRRHVADYFDLSREERNEILALLERMKETLDAELNPDGYNIGMNIGEAAGQRILHAHIHLIPRIKAGTGNPGGSVKGVIRHAMSY